MIAPRPHQKAVLADLDRLFSAGHRRAWVVMPPGSGKTLIGVLAARALGRPVVAFGPNTAIQGQWLAEWERATGTPGSLTPGGEFTALTYQALASFDPDAEVDEGGGRVPHVERLRESGRELIAALAERPVTLVLDECHHLLDVWGELLSEVLALLPDAVVIGLTATPPSALTRAEDALVRELFGELVTGPSIPAAVRAGLLAPYAELAWLTAPTERERAWLGAQADRFEELTADLLDPGFASTPFLAWLDAYAVRRSHASGDGPAVPWARFARERPEEADAVLRFHHAGMLDLPEGARPGEAHRRDPDAEDWMRLLHPFVRRFLRGSADLRDAHAHDAIRRVLPGLGYQVTAQGIRGGRSPVDRVIARSAAKIEAVRDILAVEHAALGEDLRAVVVCDHERATATLPSRLAGVLDEDAGSARLALRRLADLAWARPMLVTGRTIAAPVNLAGEFRAYAGIAGLRLDDLGGGLAAVVGPWSSRRWTPLATRFFLEGRARVLVGTRAMLGEGWDAAGVNTLVDLTEATTGTAVVQLRGRALRLDPARPAKVAHTWSVVCVEERHPKGAADYRRFVRKHDGHFGVTAEGAVLSGVPHVDAGLSPYGPPDAASFDAFNAAMAARGADRDHTRALWRVGEPYRDRVAHTVRVVGRTARVGTGTPPVWVPGPVPPGRTKGGWAAPGSAVLSAAAFALGAPLPGALIAGVAGIALYADARSARRTVRLLREASRAGHDLAPLAHATADALRECGLVSRGAEAVELEPDELGAWRVRLREVSTEESAVFARAFDEVISPTADPRYLIERRVVPDPGRGVTALARHWPLRRREPFPVVHHAVPSVLARRKHAEVFAGAWRRWVSETAALYTRGSEAELILAAGRGLSPLDVTTALRLSWD